MPAGIPIDLVTGLLSFLITIMALSYILGDNPLFRTAIYLFIGVSAGYAGAVAWHQVLVPRLFLLLLSGTIGERILAAFPLAFGILLLAKLSTRSARIGNLSMAFLTGVGAAVAIGGAATGTIFPQIQASIHVFDGIGGGDFGELLFEGCFFLIGTLTTLIYFHFGAKATSGSPQRSKMINALGQIGQGFIAVTFGMLFAGVLTAALTALIERLDFMGKFIAGLF